MIKARLVSDEEIQHIWSKLLADECNEPNSVPKSLLFTLEKMDKDDAEAFVKLCRLSVSIDKKSFPIILGDEYGKGKYDKYGIDYELLLQLDKLGLIENSVDKINEFYTSEGDLFDNTSAKAIYHDEEYDFPEDFRTIPTGKVLYTKDGQALSKAISCDREDGFWAEIARPWLEYHSKLFLENPSEYDPARELLKMQMTKTNVE